MTAFLILLETLIKKDAQKMIEVMHIDKDTQLVWR
jgi:hypothetical protein